MRSEPAAWQHGDSGRYVLPAILVVINSLARLRIEDQAARLGTAPVEVEHIVECARDRVRGTAAEAAEIPVVFDETQNRRLIGDGVVDEVDLGPGRNDQQRQAWAEAAATVLSAPAHII